VNFVTTLKTSYINNPLYYIFHPSIPGSRILLTTNTNIPKNPFVVNSTYPSLTIDYRYGFSHWITD